MTLHAHRFALGVPPNRAYVTDATERVPPAISGRATLRSWPYCGGLCVLGPLRYNGPMQIISLQSGSNGNCIYVEAAGSALLFDAGISGKQAAERLAACGRDIRAVDAVIISHDHADHARCLGIYQRKFGLPAFVTPATLQRARRFLKLGELGEIHSFSPGQPMRFGQVSVETIATPHDGADPVAFVVDDGRHRLGILTDLGHVFQGLTEAIASLHAVLLESNYDPQMLAGGWYPGWLKRRIRGPRGHLSNPEAAKLLAEAGCRLQWACLGHISEDNNDPEHARRVHRRLLGRKMEIHLATRYGPSELLGL